MSIFGGLDSLARSCYKDRMAKDRLQINIRVDDIDLLMVEALRRRESPIPTASDVWRQALREMHDRKLGPSARMIAKLEAPEAARKRKRT
jgi:hypothetical protein